jgi:hypothetical protein
MPASGGVLRFREINGHGALNIDYDPDQAIPQRIFGLAE